MITTTGFQRTAATMADGRQLLYHDFAVTPRRPDDLRDLAPRPEPPQMRYGPLTGEWVALATTRQSRVMLPTAAECPLCPSTPAFASEIPSRYEIVVFENRSPSFRTAEPTFPRPAKVAAGRCEVVCFTDEHDTSLSRLPEARIRLLVDVWADRTRELSRFPRSPR
jgi:UDPglucose--hexose-1-phosphate uridylyltransferase